MPGNLPRPRRPTCPTDQPPAIPNNRGSPASLCSPNSPACTLVAALLPRPALLTPTTPLCTAACGPMDPAGWTYANLDRTSATPSTTSQRPPARTAPASRMPTAPPVPTRARQNMVQYRPHPWTWSGVAPASEAGAGGSLPSALMSGRSEPGTAHSYRTSGWHHDEPRSHPSRRHKATVQGRVIEEGRIERTERFVRSAQPDDTRMKERQANG